MDFRLLYFHVTNRYPPGNLSTSLTFAGVTATLYNFKMRILIPVRSVLMSQSIIEKLVQQITTPRLISKRLTINLYHKNHF